MVLCWLWRSEGFCWLYFDDKDGMAIEKSGPILVRNKGKVVSLGFACIGFGTWGGYGWVITIVLCLNGVLSSKKWCLWWEWRRPYRKNQCKPMPKILANLLFVGRFGRRLIPGSCPWFFTGPDPRTRTLCPITKHSDCTCGWLNGWFCMHAMVSRVSPTQVRLVTFMFSMFFGTIIIKRLATFSCSWL